MRSNTHLCIFYDPEGKNVGLEGRRLLLTLLASTILINREKFFLRSFSIDKIHRIHSKSVRNHFFEPESKISAQIENDYLL